jgi:hypothetical protein
MGLTGQGESYWRVQRAFGERSRDAAGCSGFVGKGAKLGKVAGSLARKGSRGTRLQEVRRDTAKVVGCCGVFGSKRLRLQAAAGVCKRFQQLRRDRAQGVGGCGGFGGKALRLSTIAGFRREMAWVVRGCRVLRGEGARVQGCKGARVQGCKGVKDVVNAVGPAQKGRDSEIHGELVRSPDRVISK